MFRTPEHQVGGHMAINGRLGPLIDDNGRFYKPHQGKGRGENEVSFYKSVSSNDRIPVNILRFFPIFHGTQTIEASDGSGLLLHLVMQDVVAEHSQPSVMDVKIGSRTWYPESSEEYIKRCLKRDRESTSLSLGFRISGFQIYNDRETGFWKPNRKLLHGYSGDESRLVLRKFVSSNSQSDLVSEPDCVFASSVYGGSNGILAQLLELKAWFEDQTLYHFNSTSILMFYEKESVLNGGSSCAFIKLVDFAHFRDGDGVIDHNFLGGLCCFIRIVSDILVSSDKHLKKTANLGKEEDIASIETGL